MRVQTNNPHALAALHAHEERRSSLILHHVRLRSFRDDRPVCTSRSPLPPLHREYRLIRPANLKLSIFSVMSPLPVAASTVPFTIDGASSMIFDVSVVTCLSAPLIRSHIKQRSRQQREPLHRYDALRVDQHRRPAGYVIQHHGCRLRVQKQRGPRRATREAKKKRGNNTEFVRFSSPSSKYITKSWKPRFSPNKFSFICIAVGLFSYHRGILHELRHLRRAAVRNQPDRPLDRLYARRFPRLLRDRSTKLCWRSRFCSFTFPFLC